MLAFLRSASSCCQLVSSSVTQPFLSQSGKLTLVPDQDDLLPLQHAPQEVVAG
jgi:hypothetical protein